MGRTPMPVEPEAGRQDRGETARRSAGAGAAPPGFRRGLERWLEEAGIRVNGTRAWDIRVHDARLGARVRLHGLDGLGDAYVDGWWDCDALDEAFARVLRMGLPRPLRYSPRTMLRCLAERLLNLQTRARALRDVGWHYNLGNDLFAAMLDPLMVYSCAYWNEAKDLAGAQTAKLDLACRKVGLRPGMRLLDIGCGWGGLCRFAAERYGARVVGITLSAEQVRYARDACDGLDVDVRLMDYRDLDERFDRVVSLGMIEHVGPKNYRPYMRVVRDCLAEDGLALLQTIGSPENNPSLRHSETSWIGRNIFPGAVMPSMAQIARAGEGLLSIEDVHNIGAHYDPTLMAWAANFERNWPALAPRYGERFRRMWRYYLLSCAGSFRARRHHVWQIVQTGRGVSGYTAVR